MSWRLSKATKKCSISEVVMETTHPAEPPFSIAKKVGKAYAIEPNSDRNGLLVKKSSETQVQVYKGTAENLHFEDKKFDSAMAVFIQVYVDDLERSLREMA
ncbi:hypothetical protein MY10362_008265 [Beauveria mimosiformis]